MVGVIETFYNNVIDVYLHCVSDQLLENLIDHPLESSSGILQVEGHDFIAADGVAVGEGRHVLI